ncbi:MAG: nucleotide exchange factor GrpE [Ignavibacteriales bacterium]|nr:MAG: nucleotide exchange factor GrpE [Ignavibacteriales bacterium]
MSKDRNDNKEKNKHKDENKIEIERPEKKELKEDKIPDEQQETLNEAASEKSIDDIYSGEIIELKDKTDKLEKEVADYKDRLVRKMAEFENYKRRTENDQVNLLTYAAESFIVKILPVYDDLERSLQHIDDEKNIDAVKEGLKMVFNKFGKILDEQGVKKIEAKGKPFDHNFHEALMQQKVEGVEPHTVLEEVEPGYMYKDKVIRHTKVIVSDDGSN